MNKITLGHISDCFDKLANKGYRGLKFVLYKDMSGSFRNYRDEYVLGFDGTEHLKKFLRNMDILKEEK